MSTTFQVLLETLARETGLGRVGEETSGSSGTSTITDAKRLLGITHPPISIGDFFLITSGDQELSATLIATHYVTGAPPATTGAIAIAPALGTQLAAGDDFILWKRDLTDAKQVMKCVNDALLYDCRRYPLIPLTRLVDGDMEASGVSDWIAGDSGALDKVPTGAGEDAFARQMLSVGNTGATTGYAYQSVPVHPGETWQIIVMGRAALTVSHTPKLVIYDATNAAEITLAGDGGELEPGTASNIVSNSFTIPSGCRYIQVRLGVKTAADDVLYAWAALWRHNDTEIVLPDRIDSPGKVGRVYEAILPAEPKRQGQFDLREIRAVEKRQVRGAGGDVILRFTEGPIGSRLIFYEERQGYPELTTTDLTATTEAPANWLVAAAAARAFDLLYHTWRLADESRAAMPGQGDPNPYASQRLRWISKRNAAQRDYAGGAKTVIRYA